MTQTTPFQKRVYKLLKTVPRGKVTTYGVLAKKLKTSPRAIGQAMRTNPFAPKVPCHRVVSADGSIGGFKGKIKGKAISEKIALLRKEGVVFKLGKVDNSCIHKV
ncbi:MAG: MGMT family protein [Nanoarchaeota archaeon]|nr:MGMT family protein [Nanoarchaeota archaeon]MBU1321456.1 MGMT family protein [Nanoarchaeota archaeon]MBU1596912.1 MGMT family protein [Nanoarchaeota archaeon]MBU2441551.1 MGMT family protein [Nanoarchaeota archaeon]